MHEYVCFIKLLLLASQTWCLIRLLPLMIADLIPEEHPHWVNFLRLLELVDYVCAHETTSAIAGYLRDLIRDHHVCFKLLYPDQSMTPKFHHLRSSDTSIKFWADFGGPESVTY